MFFLSATAAFAAGGDTERILDFESEIQIHEDAAITVTETIKVVCSGREIKRGIIREIPTSYRDRLGNTVRVTLEILEVLRDGEPEPYRREKVSNGVRIFIGRKDRFLNPGVVTYTVRYRSNHQLGFFKEYDELYWNVTGNDWTFPIDHARAVIHLPDRAGLIQQWAYTGPPGSQGNDFTFHKDPAGSLVFETTRAFSPGEGFTVAVAWPKGFVREPSRFQEAARLFGDNMALPASAGGLLIVLAYYLVVWFRVGRDPEAGVIVPLFEPPRGVSPAAVRFVSRKGFDHRTFAAAVLNLAVKGVLSIDEDEGDYTLCRKNAAVADGLSPGEKRLVSVLFKQGPVLDLDRSNHRRVGKALKALRNSLAREYEKTYILMNSKHMVPGLVLTLMTLGALVIYAAQPPLALFMCLWLSIWTLGCGALAVRVITQWRAVLSGAVASWGNRAGAVGTTLFALPFVAGEIAGLGAFAAATSPAAAGLFLVLLAVNGVFYQLLKAPTLLGRKILDQIEGFRLYLSVAEKDRLGILHPPEKTPQLFEKYLPYALALDVEHEWSEQFADVLAKAGEASGGYSPAWYSGRSFHGAGAAGFAAGIGNSLSGAVASSASAPGSSSGSGGGGSSGGGGGGGGGSGW